MYLDALSFLEDEREGFRPYERLLELTDDQLAIPVDGAHGWSGRDLMGHLLHGQEVALSVARELAVGERSESMQRFDAAWDAGPDAGDRINAEALATYAALPLADLRERFAGQAGELRGYLTVVPESRWIKHAANQEWFFGETIEHYDEHAKDLQAILEAVGGTTG